MTKQFFQTSRRFLASEDGPTAAEYAVILSLIVIAAIAFIRLFGAEITGVYSMIAGAPLQGDAGGSAVLKGR